MQLELVINENNTADIKAEKAAPGALATSTGFVVGENEKVVADVKLKGTSSLNVKLAPEGGFTGTEKSTVVDRLTNPPVTSIDEIFEKEGKHEFYVDAGTYTVIVGADKLSNGTKIVP